MSIYSLATRLPLAINNISIKQEIDHISDSACAACQVTSYTYVAIINSPTPSSFNRQIFRWCMSYVALARSYICMRDHPSVASSTLVSACASLTQETTSATTIVLEYIKGNSREHDLLHLEQVKRRVLAFYHAML